MTGPRDLNAQIESLVNRLRRRQVVGSWSVSLETALLLRQVVSVARWNQVNVLINLVKDVGGKLVMAQPRELAVGNIVRRVLRLIRDVYNSEVSNSNTNLTSTSEEVEDDDKDYEDDNMIKSPPQKSKTYDLQSYSGPGSIISSSFFSSSASMINLLGDGSVSGKEASLDYDRNLLNSFFFLHLKPTIISELQELINELENMYVNIADQAMEHIHSNEIIMTVGKSRTVEMFLKTAAKKRKFSIVVAETSPKYLGHEMALSLSQAGIDTTVISDSAIFAVMSRVNKVIMGTHAVLANGGLISVSGTQMVATAAKHHSTPVVVCTGLYKLSPLYPYDEDSFNDLVAPDPVMSFDEGELIDKVTILNPYYDYVSPELVSLFITNTGGHPPSYLYRLINENYDPEDTVI
ncbi:IF-2B-domain-containing protein [Rhizophagus irregularis]|uniref:Translation initiation factor eIF2B subunit beta n=1 Tax=Rhizophagus irregularis TaxID=588596 RepID=A0A2I1H4L8_9GLOM|nr:IF-2B-domain-containing protein [Rhizophagus irregularis]